MSSGSGGRLQEPLLSQDAESSATVQQSQQSERHALILHRPFSVEEFIRAIVWSWMQFLSEYLNRLLSYWRFVIIGCSLSSMRCRTCQ